MQPYIMRPVAPSDINLSNPERSRAKPFMLLYILNPYMPEKSSVRAYVTVDH